VKVILTEEIPILGKIGTVVDVARGYGRNYLIPQGKALEATPSIFHALNSNGLALPSSRPKKKKKLWFLPPV
jgi:ribosomal protein L9